MKPCLLPPSLTGSDDLWEIELVTLRSELPEKQWILLLYFSHGALQWLEGDEHTCTRVVRVCGMWCVCVCGMWCACVVCVCGMCVCVWVWGR